MPKKKSLLAQRTSVDAHRFLGHLVIVVEGTLPSPGYEVDIEQRPTHEGLASFQVVRRAKPGMWAQLQTPFRYGELFELEAVPDEIELVHAEGADRVPVRADVGEGAAPGDPLQGQPGGQGPTVHTATGFSMALSLDEAFTDALQNLPPHPARPDQMAQVKVEEIGALFGGIAGFHQLYVKIKREIA